MNLFTNGVGVFGTYGIFKSPFQITDGAGTMPDLELSGELQMEEINYLQKGEKILSLLRERKPKHVFFTDKTLELVKYDWELTRKAVMQKIGSKLEAQFIETLKNGECKDEAWQKACEELGEKISPQVEITREKRSRCYRLVDCLCKNKNYTTINICYCEYDLSVAVGASFHKSHERGCKLRYDHGDYIQVRSFKKLVSELYMRQYLLNKLRSIRAECESMDEYLSHRVIGKFATALCRDKGCRDIQELAEWIEILGGKNDWGYFGTLILFPELEDAEHCSLKIGCYDMNRVLEALQDDYYKLKEESKMDRELSKDHAKSFQTKKNIPQKCINAMRKSNFNKYFGYVEFDEKCDLMLMKEICREYEAFAHELGLGEYPEVSLRFRKLGNHKASGLYYYLLKCLCVDVRNPDSMAHEVGHMIDYHLDHISIKYSFQEIYDKYERILKEYVSKSKGPQVDVLNGNTKYNLSYYLQPTEVFARCFEMYVVRIRGIDNSLCKPGAGFAYPDDEKLMELIKEFYDGILKNIKEEAA